MNEFCKNQADRFARAKILNAIALTEGMPNSANTRGPHGHDTRETSETYRGELFRLGRFRVAACRDERQWLYQRKRGTISPGGVAWDTLGYCVSKKALMRLHRSHNCFEAQAISELPCQFSGGIQND